MQCKTPVTVNGQQFNCGSCMACRINYTTSWSLRLLYELSTVNAASFLTLTYNNESLPRDYSLNQRDLTLFWKKLRSAFQREYHEFAPKLRYYAVGEYGDKQKIYYSPGAIKPHGRPHFHAIVFGLDNYDDRQREIVAKCWNKCEPWLFDKSRGRESAMQEVTPYDIGYVTGYAQKKLSGQAAREEYGEALPPFSVCSQGLGLDFAMKNKERLLDNGWTVFNGHRVSIPRYFCEKFDVKKSELLKDNPLPDSKDVMREVLNLDKLFVEDMHRKYGIDYSHPQDKQLTLYSKRFEQWYNDKCWDIRERIYQDFLQRQKLRGKGL